jgi:hypothetical protein
VFPILSILFRVKIGFITPVRRVVRLASEYGSVETSLCLLNVSEASAFLILVICVVIKVMLYYQE